MTYVYIQVTKPCSSYSKYDRNKGRSKVEFLQSFKVCREKDQMCVVLDSMNKWQILFCYFTAVAPGLVSNVSWIKFEVEFLKHLLRYHIMRY